MTAEALIATCWTSAGNVRPGRTADTSTIPLEHRVRAVADAGFAGIGFEWADLELAKRTLGWDALGQLIHEAGIPLVEVEFLNDWWIAGERRAVSDVRRRGLLEAAEALGADHIKLGGGDGSDPVDPEAIRAEFRTLADEAAAHHTRIALEPGAFSALGHLPDAVSIVTDVGHPAGGLMLDIWHLYRSGFHYEDLIGLVPRDAIVGVEIDDGAAEPVGTIFDDTFDNRLECGQGAFDVPRFIRIVRSLGYDGPWGVELMSDHRRSLPVEVALADARDGALACLREVGSR